MWHPSSSSAIWPRASTTAPFFAIANLRTGEPLVAPLDEAVEEFGREARVRELRPLERDDVETMIRIAGVSPDPAQTSLVVVRSASDASRDGNQTRDRPRR